MKKLLGLVAVVALVAVVGVTTVYLTNKPTVAPSEFKAAASTYPVALSGKWDGVNWGVGEYYPTTGRFSIKSATDQTNFVFGSPGWIPVSGDWDRDGKYTIGAYDPATATFYLRNSNSAGSPDVVFSLGRANLIPISGDWDGDGRTTVGVYDPATGQFLLSNSLIANPPSPLSFVFGSPNMLPVSGDWNGDGKFTIGAYNPATGTFYLRNANTSGYADLSFVYGSSNLQPVTGKWTTSGSSSIAVFDLDSNNFYIRNTNTTGYADQVIFMPQYARVAMADFYWWYPWYGMQYIDPQNTSNHLPPRNIKGNVAQDAFSHIFTSSIPYLKSEERPLGVVDVNDALAKAWFKGNFQRAAAAGVSVLTIMTRPDLGQWKHALTLMLTSQKELRDAGLPYPKLLFHFDGVEYWDKTTPSTGSLTGPGQDYNVIWSGVKDSYDTIFQNLTAAEIKQFIYTYPDGNTFPNFVYRIEGNAHNFTTDNWWVTKLKADFEATYPGKHLYLVLDGLWCGTTDYGVNNSVHARSCNADNYYVWGGALGGAQKSSLAKGGLTITTVGPGFDNSKFIYNSGMLRSRDNGNWYSTNLNLMNTYDTQWLLLETFNFGEEGSGIDQMPDYGSQYLDLTRNFVTTWKNQ